MCMKIIVCGSTQFEPKMTELMTSISVQPEYGVTKYAANGILARRKFIENAVYNVFTQVNSTKGENRV